MGNKIQRRFWVLFLSVISFGEVTSGERSKLRNSVLSSMKAKLNLWLWIHWQHYWEGQCALTEGCYHLSQRELLKSTSFLIILEHQTPWKQTSYKERSPYLLGIRAINKTSSNFCWLTHPSRLRGMWEFDHVNSILIKGQFGDTWTTLKSIS